MNLPYPYQYARRSAQWRGLKARGGCKSPDDCRSITKNQGTDVPRSPNEFIKSTPLGGATGVLYARRYADGIANCLHSRKFARSDTIDPQHQLGPIIS